MSKKQNEPLTPAMKVKQTFDCFTQDCPHSEMVAALLTLATYVEKVNVSLQDIESTIRRNDGPEWAKDVI